MLFEGLVDLHSTKNEPIGILAESWIVSEDGKTFTFKINPKAKWSDGREVTAEDVQFYFDIMMDKNNMTSLFASTLIGSTDLKWSIQRQLKSKAHEKHWSNFWSAGSLCAFPKHIWKNVDFNKQNFEFPVVSGPYKIKEVKKKPLFTSRAT